MYQIEANHTKKKNNPFIYVTESTDQKAKWQSDHKALKAIQPTYTNPLPHITIFFHIHMCEW